MSGLTAIKPFRDFIVYVFVSFIPVKTRDYILFIRFYGFTLLWKWYNKRKEQTI